MKKIFAIITMVFLLIVEAIIDINFAKGTADLINIGIIKKGIDQSIPFFVDEEYFAIAEKYFDIVPEIKEYYQFVSKEQIEQLEQYGITNPNNVYILKDGVDIQEVKDNIQKIIKPLVSFQNVHVQLQIKRVLRASLSNEQYTRFTSNITVQKLAILEEMLPKETIDKVVAILQENGELIDDIVLEECINQMNQKEFQKLGLDLDLIGKKYVSDKIKILLFMVLMNFLAQYFMINIVIRLSENVAGTIKMKLTRKMFRLSNQQIEEIGKTELYEMVAQDTKKLKTVLPIILKEIIYSPIILLIGMTIIIQKTNWIVALSIILSIVASFITAGIFMLLLLPKMKKGKELENMINENMNRMFNGIIVIRSFLREKWEEKKIQTITKQSEKKLITSNKLLCALVPILIMILAISLGIIYLQCVKLIDKGTMQVGDLVQIFQLTILIISAFFGMIVLGILIPTMIDSYRKTSRILKMPDKIETGNITFEHFPNEKIVFDNVTVKKNDYCLLEGASFSILPGKLNAVIGKNGSGKTTIVNLLLQEEILTEGKIRIGEVDFDNISSETIKKLISVSTQENYIFSGSIESNLKLANKNISKEEMLKAIKIASIDNSFEKSNHNILERRILLGGINLSGGQKQRVAIANAIAHQPDLLILDDSFSSLDMVTAQKIKSNIRHELKDKTILMVSQKISDVRDADHIIVCDEGKVIAEGTHQSLKESCDLYMDLINTQVKEGI